MSACSLTIVGIPYLLTKLTLVRRGELGVCEWVNGKIRVLGPGWHLLETVNTTVTKAELTSDLIRHGALTILRILPGNVGLGTVNGYPVILGPGRHLINDPYFQFLRQEAMTVPHITVGTVHLITVQSGKVGLCTVDSTAHFLEPGRHNINNPRFTFLGFRESTEEHISVGSKHRILVPAGRIGCAWQDGEPLFLEPGRVYNIDSPRFSYVNSVSAVDNIITHGRLKLVTVREGNVGITYDDGKLVILPPGRHSLTKATQFLAGFLSIGQVVLPVTSVDGMTSDNVPITFDAAVSIRVVDPAKAVTMLCTSADQGTAFKVAAMHNVIVQQAKLHLSIIIGNNRLNNSFKSTTRTAKAAVFDSDAKFDRQQPVLSGGGAAASASTASSASAKGGAGAKAAAEDPTEDGSQEGGVGFRQVIHDVFMHNFSESMLNTCGIEVIDMSIEDIRITNTELAKAMAQGAVARTSLIKAQIDTEVTRTSARAEQQAEISRAEGKARALQITAAAEAEKTKIAAAAEAERTKIAAAAEAERTKIAAAAEAERTKIAAAAEAEKVRLLADAEAERIAAVAAAEAKRIATLDAAMASVSAITQQREIVRASGEVLAQSKSSLLLAHSTTDVASLLGARGGAGAMLS